MTAAATDSKAIEIPEKAAGACASAARINPGLRVESSACNKVTEGLRPSRPHYRDTARSVSVTWMNRMHTPALCTQAGGS